MGAIDIAMARSLRPPAWELVRNALARRVAQGLSQRSVVNDAQNKVTDVKTAFSSWNNCMKATFCKWPVIAIIIVGSLIIFRSRKTKYLDEPYIPPNHGQAGQAGYHTQAPMQNHVPFPPAPAPAPAPAPPPPPPPEPSKFRSPQYAVFDVSKKGADDALPHMPTWDQHADQKVMVEEGVEMSNMKTSPTWSQTRRHANAPSPRPVSPISAMNMNLNGQSYGGVPGSASGQMSNHSQQDLVPNQPAMRYRQPGPGIYGARDIKHHQTYNAKRQSEGFGLDEPYDEPSSMSNSAVHGHPSQQPQLYDGPAHQPYDSLADQPYGAVAAVEAGAYAGMRNQPGSLRHPQSYGAPPMGVRNNSTSLDTRQPFYGTLPIADVAMASGGRQYPAPTQAQAYHQHSYRQEEVEQIAEMPANPPDHRRISASDHAQRVQTSPIERSALMELPGSVPQEAPGVRRPRPANKAAQGFDRSPLGQDPRTRNSPGPREPPGGPRGESPFDRPSRGLPDNDQGYGRSLHQVPRENTNRSYSSAPPQKPSHRSERRFTPEPERHNSSLTERQRTPAPHTLSRPVPPPSNSFNQSSPPQSPITNSAGFDFTSGYSRPQVNLPPTDQSPTSATYPGQRTYQCDRQHP
ncbi:hypothetical protein E4U30_005770 [Claviceps sp. LM220 group G6]|nr:hypothetical protein E4U30_005770 [Claviceps sp. LM220 group G6]